MAGQAWRDSLAVLYEPYVDPDSDEEPGKVPRVSPPLLVHRDGVGGPHGAPGSGCDGGAEVVCGCGVCPLAVAVRRYDRSGFGFTAADTRWTPPR